VNLFEKEGRRLGGFWSSFETSSAGGDGMREDTGAIVTKLNRRWGCETEVAFPFGGRREGKGRERKGVR